MPPEAEYCLIPLTQGQFAKVSPHRFEELSKFKWFAWWSKSTQSFYARRNSRVSEGLPRHGIGMHRSILGLKYGDPTEGDHKNRDTLDNTDENLRLADQTEQCRNQGIRKDNKSGYRGVRIYKNLNKWGAAIRVNRKNVFLGVFPMDARIEAAMAYDRAAIHYFGVFAHLNFPLNSYLAEDCTVGAVIRGRRRASFKSLHRSKEQVAAVPVGQPSLF